MSPERLRYDDYQIPEYLPSFPDAPEKPSKKSSKLFKCLVGFSAIVATVIGGVDGAARASRINGGSIVVGAEPSEVELKKTTIKHEICVADAEMALSGTAPYKVTPLGEEAAKWGLFYQRKLTATEVPRTVDYCFKDQDLQYDVDFNQPYQRDGGSPDKPTIKAVISMDSLIPKVQTPADIRADSYKPTSDGLFAPLAGVLSKYAEQEAVQKFVEAIPGATNDPAPEAQLDNLLRGALDANLNQIAAEACLAAGREYNWAQPVIKTLLTNAIKQAILDDFRQQYEDRAQPRPEDIDLQLTEESLKLGDGVEVKGGKSKEDLDKLAELMAKPRKYAVQLGPVSVDVEITILPVESQKVACNVTPEAVAGANAQPTQEAKR